MGFFDKFVAKVFGTANQRYLKRIKQRYLEETLSAEREFDKLPNKKIREIAIEYIKKVREDKVAPESILPEYFALVREAAKRTIGKRHFDVQILGGIVLFEGKIAEMKTGEGKTLVATLPLALTALEGRGCHLVTVNDYLARRDAMWMGPIYKFLGLEVGVINHLEVSYTVDWQFPDLFQKAIEDDVRAWPADNIINDPLPQEKINMSAIGAFQTTLIKSTRKQAYLCDITYGTNNEFAFDYLRDNMKYSLDEINQRELYYAIVDEVDSILIDEARTPLIISGPAEEDVSLYYKVDKVARVLKQGEDFDVDEKSKQVLLKEKGIEKAERFLGISNLYDPVNVEILHHLIQSLRAHRLFRRDVDYVVKDGKVVIVDEFTGRLMPGRRWSDGLHQAIEAKEGLKIEAETQTLASISFQNFFRMYKKLAGMTGTAETEALEFKEIYNLDVIVIPTHRPMIREDYDDVVYLTEEEKFEEVIKEIQENWEKGRPVLVGTTSIEKSEKLSSMLRAKGIPHQVLNAKNHEKEAYIIAQAGRLKAVTVATNMAGRGVDIILGGNAEMLARQKVGFDATPEEFEKALKEFEQICSEERKKVVELGGLHVIGTERHESRRIDNQLRGRSGRQGDPGSSRFYVSLQDDLMRIFGSDRVAPLMKRFGMKTGEPIEHRWVTKAIQNAQKRVEAYNFEIRKHLLEYDNVMNKQRETVYSLRRKVLSRENTREIVFNFIEDVISHLTEKYMPKKGEPDLDGFEKEFFSIFGFKPENIEENLTELVKEKYEKRFSGLNDDIVRRVEQFIILNTLDTMWRRHLYAMDQLRESVSMRGYGHLDPLVEYKKEGFSLFLDMITKFKISTISKLFMMKVERGEEEEKEISEAMTNLSRRAQRISPYASVGGYQIASGGSAIQRTPTIAGTQTTGTQRTSIQNRKVGRNDLCPCGSGKKYKKCCGRAN
ncbi:MAG: preprotein translocase subunit SecA [Candidatus Calescibacterium sp.]|nr:preprotein translocase subunit SecA [Candidatus Calescibacterium sp.]